MTTLIHITHEAHEKMGGIGAVLEGLLTTRSYQAAVDRTILLSAGDVPERNPPESLVRVLYRSGTAHVGPDELPQAVASAFARIEAAYGVRITYGIRRVPCPLATRRATAELLLIDVRHAHAGPVNQLKGRLWQAYGLQSDRYENDWGYEEWVRLAMPALEATDALLGSDVQGAALVSHEFMGLPTLLTARLTRPALRTIYWAHEVPPVRDMVEQAGEEMLLFDQALRTQQNLDVFQERLRQWGGYKHALVSRAHLAGRIFAVSDRVAQELHLLAPEFARSAIDVVYNGLPARPISLEARMASRERLRRYAQAVVGFKPDFVFTHVARPVASKAIQRDLAVLEHLDDLLAERGQSAVLLILATDAGRRDGHLVRQMEAEYGWPMFHRVGWPDLVKGEVPIGQATEQYNGWARATRAVLINQFGLSRETCGLRVPEDLTCQDVRQGSDVEFGQSAYEPFGIAQLETLAFGGISVISGVCGCAQLLARVAGDALPQNVLLAHYAAPACNVPVPVTEGETRRIEHAVAAQLARELVARLPTSPQALADLLASGWALAEKMSWQSVCREYFIPALERCFDRPCRRPALAARPAAPPMPVNNG